MQVEQLSRPRKLTSTLSSANDLSSIPNTHTNTAVLLDIDDYMQEVIAASAHGMPVIGA